MRIKVLGLLTFGLLLGGLAIQADEAAKTCCRKAKAPSCSSESKAPETCCPCERAKARPDGCDKAKAAGCCAAAKSCGNSRGEAKHASEECAKRTECQAGCSLKAKPGCCAEKVDAKQVAAKCDDCKAKTVKK